MPFIHPLYLYLDTLGKQQMSNFFLILMQDLCFGQILTGSDRAQLPQACLRGGT